MEKGTQKIGYSLHRLLAGKNIEAVDNEEDKRKELVNSRKKEVQSQRSQRKAKIKASKEKERKKVEGDVANYKEKDRDKTITSKEIGWVQRSREKEKEKEKTGQKVQKLLPNDRSKRKKKKSKSNNRRTKPKAINSEMLMQTYTRNQSKNANKPRSVPSKTMESVVCPEEISSHIDALPEYMAKESTGMEMSFVDNNDNSGSLFVNGVPFWMVKDKQPPPEAIFEPITVKLKEIIDGKFALLYEDTEPKDIDPNHEFSYMATRDYEYFDKPNKLISNTIRSLMQSDNKEGQKASLEDAEPPAVPQALKVTVPQEASLKVNFVLPTEMILYNRKNYLEPPRLFEFRPGKKKC